MDNPPVTVREITRDELEQVGADQQPKDVSLGGGHTMAADQLNGLRRRIAQDPNTRLFLLSWQGNKIPRGANILGYEVVWTQNGAVNTNDGPIGTYDRLVEFGGATSKEQVMLCYIYAKPKEAAANQ